LSREKCGKIDEIIIYEICGPGGICPRPGLYIEDYERLMSISITSS